MAITKEILGDRLTWVAIDSDKVSQTSNLYAEYGIDEELISYALDRNERAHFYEFISYRGSVFPIFGRNG